MRLVHDHRKALADCVDLDGLVFLFQCIQGPCDEGKLLDRGDDNRRATRERSG